MTSTTPLLGLIKATGSDKDGTYLKISLAQTLDILDTLPTLTSSSTLTNKTLTAPHLTTPVVDSGGLAITAGGLTITAGGLTVTAGGLTVAAGGITLTGGGTLTGALTLASVPLTFPVSQSGPNKTVVLSSDGGGGPINIYTNTVGGAPSLCIVRFDVATGTAAGSLAALLVNGGGSVVAGAQVALANGAADGFTYIPSGGGTPSGTPTVYGASIPVRFNTADNKLYAYIAGGWKASGAFA